MCTPPPQCVFVMSAALRVPIDVAEVLVRQGYSGQTKGQQDAGRTQCGLLRLVLLLCSFQHSDSVTMVWVVVGALLGHCWVGQ
jgi:hypothetical protein